MLARPQFDVLLAQERFAKIKIVLQQYDIQVEAFDEPVTSSEEATVIARKLKDKCLDAVIAVQGTFADASIVLSLSNYMDTPLLIWAIKEEPQGERLHLNSFCGLNLGAHALVMAGKKFKGVYGNPESQKIMYEVLAFIKAAGAINWLKGKRIGVAGTRPAGYYPSNFNEIKLYSTLGISVEFFPLERIFSLANRLNGATYPTLTTDLCNYDQVDINAAQKSICAYLAMKEIIPQMGVDAIAVECWPEFMVNYGGAACFALSQLNDDGIVAACEADVNAAVTMLLAQYWSKKATFLADLIGADEKDNKLIFWHCGNGPRTLIAEGAKAVAGVHPNRKIPLSLYFPLKGGEVTISRLGVNKNNLLRLLSIKGTGLEAPMLFNGNSLPVQLEHSVAEAINNLIYQGFEHHYVVMYGDFTRELKEFARLLDLEIIEI